MIERIMLKLSLLCALLGLGGLYLHYQENKKSFMGLIEYQLDKNPELLKEIRRLGLSERYRTCLGGDALQRWSKLGLLSLVVYDRMDETAKEDLARTVVTGCLVEILPKGDIFFFDIDNTRP